MIKNPNSENSHLHYIFMQKHNFSEAQLFLQQIIKGVIKGATIFTPMVRVYSFMALLSAASVCLIPVIKCGIHFQLSIHGALNAKYNCMNTEEQ